MSKNALLFVGYEEESGDVISVAGVTVLGIRGAYAPPMLAARRPGTAMNSHDYNSCREFGYKRGLDDAATGRAFDLNGAFKKAGSLGYPATWSVAQRVACREVIAIGYKEGFAAAPPPTPTPAPISAPQSSPFEGGYMPVESLKPKPKHAPSPADAAPGNASSSMFNFAVRGW